MRKAKNLKALFRFQGRILQDVMDTEPFSESEIKLIGVLDDHKRNGGGPYEFSFRALGRQLNIAFGAFKRALETLEEVGYCSYEPGSKDGRRASLIVVKQTIPSISIKEDKTHGTKIKESSKALVPEKA